MVGLQTQFWTFILHYLPRFFNIHPPPPPPPPPQVPEVAIDIVQTSTPQPPPNNYHNHWPAPDNTVAANSSPTIHFHPITLLIRELELGKSIFNFGVPITITLLISIQHAKDFQTSFTYFMVSGLSIGSVAIWNGIVHRETFPRTANVIEQLGILLVLLSFSGLLGSVVPPNFMWVAILCSGLSMLPFLVQVFSYCKPNQIDAVAT